MIFLPILYIFYRDMSLETKKFVTLIYEKYSLRQNNGDSPIRNAVILKNYNPNQHSLMQFHILVFVAHLQRIYH